MNRTKIHEPWAKPWTIDQGLTLSTIRSSLNVIWIKKSLLNPRNRISPALVCYILKNGLGIYLKCLYIQGHCSSVSWQYKRMDFWFSLPRICQECFSYKVVVAEKCNSKLEFRVWRRVQGKTCYCGLQQLSRYIWDKYHHRADGGVPSDAIYEVLPDGLAVGDTKGIFWN